MVAIIAIGLTRERQAGINLLTCGAPSVAELRV